MAKVYIFDNHNLQFKPYKRPLFPWIVRHIFIFIVLLGSVIAGTYFFDDKITTWQEQDYLAEIKILEYQIQDLQSQKTYDSLWLELALEDNILRFQHTPLIKPIHPDDFSKDLNLMSGYGRRYHPILRLTRLHTGLDFAAKTGTRIIATADGIVETVKKSKSGYGNHIIINHGYGYKTLYAHLSEIQVERGEDITRGHVIGLVGNTGLSLAPHLHYEIQVNDKAIDPLPFVLDNVTTAEYDRWVKPLD